MTCNFFLLEMLSEILEDFFTFNYIRTKQQQNEKYSDPLWKSKKNNFQLRLAWEINFSHFREALKKTVYFMTTC